MEGSTGVTVDELCSLTVGAVLDTDLSVHSGAYAGLYCASWGYHRSPQKA